jgi:hypothetical protein
MLIHHREYESDSWKLPASNLTTLRAAVPFEKMFPDTDHIPLQFINLASHSGQKVFIL